MRRVGLCSLLLVLCAAVAPATSFAAARSCSPAQYNQHLRQLQSLLAGCAAARTAQACNGAAVGPDDRVASATGSRLVSYTWLREVLDAAAKPAAGKAPRAQQDQRLQAAALRLRDAVSTLAPTPGVADPQLQQAHAKLDRILASGQFPPPPAPSLFARAWDWLLQWLVRRLMGLAAYSSRSRWLTLVFIAGALVPACALLLWWVRRAALRRAAADRPSANAPQPSAGTQDWQRWLGLADELAAEKRWREGIHGVYWAAIARLETRGLWRTDRSRTPREYLALLDARSPNYTALQLLTRSFESTWYGEQPAGEGQFRDARAALQRLVGA